MLEAANLNISYKGIRVVHGVSFRAAKEKLTVLIGANGAGKSSIIKAVMGLVPAESGEILYCGNSLKGVPPYHMSAAGISLCPEGRQLFSEMTVVENLEMGAYARKDRFAVRTDIEAVLKKFPRLLERRDQKAGTMSGGEQELLAIARALMASPKLLILDEPSWGLAPLMVEEVMRIVKEICQDTQTTVLLAEQNANVALRYADYAYVLDVGTIAAEGTGEAILHDEQVQQIYLGA